MNQPIPFFQTQHATLHHGDCLRVIPQLGCKFDAIVSDPPYSSGGTFRSDRTRSPLDKYVFDEHQHRYQGFSGDSRDQRGYYRWCVEWLLDLHDLAAPHALLMLFCDWRQLPVMTDAIQSAGWMWRGILPWDKTEASRPQKGFFRAQCEYILVGLNGNLRTADAPAEYAPGIFRHPITHADKHHPTGKPTALMRDLLRVLPVGSHVLDMFAGSGTTGVAAAELGMRCTLIEKDLHHCEVIKRRLEGLQPVLL